MSTLFPSDHLLWHFTSTSVNALPSIFPPGHVSGRTLGCPIRKIEMYPHDINLPRIALNRLIAAGLNPGRGVTELHIEAACGNFEAVSAILSDNRGLVDSRTFGTRFTPLHFAVSSGDLATVKVLIFYKADVNAFACRNYSPLACACERGDVEMMIALKMGKAKIYTLNNCLGTLLHLTAKVNCWSILAFLINSNFRVDDINKNRMTALHIATERSHVDFLDCLIGCCASVTSTFDALNRRLGTRNCSLTALHLAAYQHTERIVDLVVNAGASIDATTGDGVTPLHIACHRGSVHAVRELIRLGANINARDFDGFTPLHDAAAGNRLLIVRTLLNYRGNVDAQSTAGNTPLHIAALRGFKDVAYSLVHDWMASVTLLNSAGQSALHCAVMGRATDIVEMLIISGAHPLLPDARSWLPIHHGGMANLGPVGVQMLLDAGDNVNVATDRGWTALHCAVFFNSVNMARTLIYNNANVNAMGGNGCTPLHLAVRRGSEEMVNMLLAAEADVEAVDAFGWTSLHFAAHRGLYEIISMLLVQGRARVDAVTEYGITPLHFAVKFNHFSCAKYLVFVGADVNRWIAGGVRPIHLAARYADEEMVVFLLRRNAFFNVRTDGDARVNNGVRLRPSVTAMFNINRRVGEMFLAITRVFRSVSNTQEALMAMQEYLRDGGIADVCRWRCGSLLSKVVSCDNEQLFTLLMTHKPNLELRSRFGLIPLHHAVIRNKYNLVVLLMQRGSPFDSIAYNSMTPLRLAMSLKFEKMRVLFVRMERYFNTAGRSDVYGIDMLINLKKVDLELFLAATRTIDCTGSTIIGIATRARNMEFVRKVKRMIVEW